VEETTESEEELNDDAEQQIMVDDSQNVEPKVEKAQPEEP